MHRQAQLRNAGHELVKAEQIARDIDELKHAGLERAAPDAKTIKHLEEIRTRAGKLKSELDASAISLTIATELNALPARLTLDDDAAIHVNKSNHDANSRYSIRHGASLSITGWGRMDIQRGVDARGLDKIEEEFNGLEKHFAERLAVFGVPANQADAMDQLRGLLAEKTERESQVKMKQNELSLLVPKGIDHLREQIAELERVHKASQPSNESGFTRGELPSEPAQLDTLTSELVTSISSVALRIGAAESEFKSLEETVEGEALTTARNSETQRPSFSGFRHQESAARQDQATKNERVKVLREEIAKMLSTQDIEGRISQCESAVAQAKTKLQAVNLTADEKTVEDRLAAAKKARDSLE
ncbi:MAG: hypothetical protein ACRD36_08505, partial [Candidatus Acidiferrum sp.]